MINVRLNSPNRSKKLRKPKDILKKKITGIRVLNNIWKSINSKETTPNGRLNNNTVILKAFR